MVSSFTVECHICIIKELQTANDAGEPRLGLFALALSKDGPVRSLHAALCRLVWASGIGLGAALLITLPAQAGAAEQDLRMTPVVRAVQNASPAVVNIKASKVVQRGSSPF